ncbi:hypothetical protein V6N13_068263 [Hibiscus sabdariffa]|uniref:Uncharacterized protein n=2 Tax=Hibiscus sabdariffa TaxID=183260 RepID=A0ABR2B038_9ROSI
MVRMGSNGWKLLGPYSHRYPSLSKVVMLPPTLTLASVTITLDVTSWALDDEEPKIERFTRSRLKLVAGFGVKGKWRATTGEERGPLELSLLEREG